LFGAGSREANIKAADEEAEAAHCNTLHCNTLQHTATHKDIDEEADSWLSALALCLQDALTRAEPARCLCHCVSVSLCRFVSVSVRETDKASNKGNISQSLVSGRSRGWFDLRVREKRSSWRFNCNFSILGRISCVCCLAYSLTHCNTLQHTATHCNTLQHTATHCNTTHHTTLQHTTLQQPMTDHGQEAADTMKNTATQHTAPHCNTLRCNSPRRQIAGRLLTHCNALQHNTLHHTAPYYSATAHDDRWLRGC